MKLKICGVGVLSLRYDDCDNTASPTGTPTASPTNIPTDTPTEPIIIEVSSLATFSRLCVDGLSCVLFLTFATRTLVRSSF